MVDKIITGIIGRVNVNHLDTTKVGFAKYFENIEIVTLDVEVFGVESSGGTVLAYRFFAARTKGKVDGFVGKTGGDSLVWPSELIAFLSFFNYIV